MVAMRAATKKGGTSLAAPDVCKTPPTAVPVPYPNIASLSGTDKTSKKVLCENKQTICENSKVPSTKGDEVGTLKGVVSQKNRGEAKFRRYSGKVFAEGKKVVYHTAIVGQNGGNAN